MWQDEAKTLFDPCPSGWRVPRGGTGYLSSWYPMGNNDLQYLSGQWQTESGGAEWQLAENGRIWYAGAGCRYTTLGGILVRVGIESDCWTTTPQSSSDYYFNFSAQPTAIYRFGTYHAAAAFSVRCVRE